MEAPKLIAAWEASSKAAEGMSTANFWPVLTVEGFMGTLEKTTCQRHSKAQVASQAGATACVTALGTKPPAITTVPASWSMKIGPQIAKVKPAGVINVGYAAEAFALSAPNTPLLAAKFTAKRTA